MDSQIQGLRKEEAGAATTSLAVADPRGRFFSVYTRITMDHEHTLAAKTKGSGVFPFFIICLYCCTIWPHQLERKIGKGTS